MDSRLLNVFHDDPFDGNYSKFDSNADFWSSSSEAMGLQLTETLHGILPIAPTEDDVADSIYASAIIKDDFHLENSDDVVVTSTLQSKNALIYDHFSAEQHFAAGGTIEIVTVDPNATDDFYSSNDSDDDDEGESDLEAVDQRSQYSNSTFRTRTDSSSIGDYESHSSDYDDDDEEDQPELQQQQQQQQQQQTLLLNTNDSVSGILAADDLIMDSSFKLPLEMVAGSSCKSRTLSTNTFGSDVDGLGLQIDASTFDLADFITKDDFALNTTCMPTHLPAPPPVAVATTAAAVGATVGTPQLDLGMLTATTRGVLVTPPPQQQQKQQQHRPTPAPIVHVINSRHTDSDSDDSDVIVDVETVEMDSEDEEQAALLFAPKAATMVAAAVAVPVSQPVEVPYVDNVKADPSWSPKQVKKNEAPTVNEVKTPQIYPGAIVASPAAPQPSPQAQNFGRKFALVPSKRQCDFLKGKYGCGRGKTLIAQQQQQRNAKLATAKKMPEQNSAAPTAAAGKKTTGTITATTTTVASKTELSKKTAPTNTSTTSAITRRIGMGKGGKNLALIKHDRQSISEQSSEEYSTPVKHVAEVEARGAVVIAQEVSVAAQPAVQQQKQQSAVKRKLNLEEYKKRRGDVTSATITNGKFETYKIPKLEIGKTASTSTASGPNKNNSTTNISTTPTKHSAAVTSIVRSLKAEQQQRPIATDPITEAKNKVLRMQEMKRAQQLRILDSAVSAKVPRVTKVLPLHEIIRETDAAAEQKRRKAQNAPTNAYEEIIIVSASCNTDISMPPNGGGMLPQLKNASRSLLKSSALLYNISNSFQKVQQQAASDSSIKISNNSLLVSIQDAVVKQTAPTAVAAACSVINAAAVASATAAAVSKRKVEQHGEDKIIMHLRKDRIRQRTLSIATQTEFAAEFPPLPLPKAAAVAAHKSRERTRRKYRKRNVSPSSASSSSDCSDNDNDDSDSGGGGGASYRSRSRSANSSCSSAASLLAVTERTSAAGAVGGGYSSRSSRRHRSSISSSYSESDRRAAEARNRHQRRSSYKRRSKNHARDSSSSSMSDYSQRSSRSRTRSRSPHYRQRSPRSKRNVGNGYQQQHQNNNNSFADRNVSQPAVEERRIVYVGRIEQETTKEMLRRKFLSYGNIKQITIHYKDTGMKYGFVTYERSQDAFTVIDTSARDSQINMYDISFGGRRAFCRASYADLDNAGINTYQSYVFPKAPAPPKEEDSFEALLLKVKAKMNASKPATTATENGATSTSKI